MDDENEQLEVKSPDVKSVSYPLFIVAGIIFLGVIAGGYYLYSKANAKNNVLETNVTLEEELESDVTPVALGDSNVNVSEPVDSESSTIFEITVEGSIFKFTPATFKVKAGQTVRLTFKNTEGFHDLVFDDLDVRTKQIMAGASDTVEFTAPSAPGEFTFYCSVANHRAMGMVGKMIVE